MPSPSPEAEVRDPEALSGLRAAHDGAVRHFEDAPSALSLRLAGHPAILRSEDEGLLRALARPFGHLAEEGGGGPELRVLLSSAHRYPGGLPDLGPEPPPGQARVAHAEDGRFVAYLRAGTLAAFDRAAGTLVVWAAEEFPESDRGQPLFGLLAVWLHDLDLQLVHAGLVARGDDGALLGGVGGSGKSTTALSCLRAGLSYLGDDSIALSIPQGPSETPRGHSLYASARLEPHNVRRFPELAGTVEPLDPREPDKLVLYPLEGQGLRTSGASAALRAVLLPRVTGGTPRAVPLAPAKALLLLAPSSLRAMSPQPMAPGLDRLARLVERVPCYQLEVGEDLAAVAAEVERVISGGVE